MSSTSNHLPDLVDMAVEDTVTTARPEAGHWLISQLEAQGDEAMWDGACLLLAPLAERPAYGLPVDKAADRLRLTARTAQPDVAFILSLKLAYQVQGRGAAAEVWMAGTHELRRTAIMHLLIMFSAAIGHHGRRLSPEGTVALVRRAIPAPPGAAG